MKVVFPFMNLGKKELFQDIISYFYNHKNRIHHVC